MIISGTGSRGQGSKLEIRGSLQLQVQLETVILPQNTGCIRLAKSYNYTYMSHILVLYICNPQHGFKHLSNIGESKSLAPFHLIINNNQVKLFTCGNRATNLGGEPLLGMYRHIGTTSLARHLFKSAENNVVLPVTLCETSIRLAF